LDPKGALPDMPGSESEDKVDATLNLDIVD
jgi:hypothetical protein